MIRPPRLPSIPMTCRECGGGFTAAQRTAKWCSVACQSRAYRRRHGLVATPREPIRKACPACGDTFLTVKDRLACTPRCHATIKRREAGMQPRQYLTAGMCPEHPAFRIYGRGVCKACYQRQWFRQWYRERRAARAGAGRADAA